MESLIQANPHKKTECFSFASGAVPNQLSDQFVSDNKAVAMCDKLESVFESQ